MGTAVPTAWVQHGDSSPYSMGTAWGQQSLQHGVQYGVQHGDSMGTALATAWVQHGYSSPYSMGYSMGYSTPRIIDLSGFLGSLAPRVVRFLGSP